jgi:hypothetical protein
MGNGSGFAAYGKSTELRVFENRLLRRFLYLEVRRSDRRMEKTTRVSQFVLFSEY